MLSPLIVLVVLAVIVEARVSAPLLVSMFDELKKLMLPVEAFPSLSVWKLVVPKTPLPVSVVAPKSDVPAETDAVGVPAPVLLRNPNFAEAVDVPPMNVSRVVLIG